MRRILVIDDDVLIIENVKEVLELEGYDVQSAKNGKRGIQVATDFAPELILCDVSMPIMNGYEVLKFVREQSSLRLIPFIFLTARISREDMRLGMNLGADDYLTKPFSISELLDMVASRLQHYDVRLAAHKERLETMRDNIIHSLPHELRTPLTAISGYANLLAEDAHILSPVEVKTMADSIVAGSNRLYALIENYLLFSQLELLLNDEEKVLTLRDIEPIDNTNLIILDTTHRLKLLYLNRNHIVLNLQEGRPRIEYDNFTYILKELLTNAHKFSRKQTTITLETLVDMMVGYTVRITSIGIGLDDEEIHHIDSYIQFDRKKHEIQGLGLGLAIVQRILRIYDGTMKITSTPTDKPDDYKTTVTVNLPI